MPDQDQAPDPNVVLSAVQPQRSGSGGSKSAEPAPLTDHPFIRSVKALLDHLAGEPKHAILDGLWRTCRAEWDKFTGTQSPAGRVAGDEHPDFRSGTSPDMTLAGQSHPGADALPEDHPAHEGMATAPAQSHPAPMNVTVHENKDRD